MVKKSFVLQASVLVSVVTLFSPSILFADGYRNAPEGAAAIGAFGGHRAFADDANATIHNSANLVDIEQPMVQLNTTFGYGRTDVETYGISGKTEDPSFIIPGFSAVVPINGRCAIGFASYVPFGRSVDWGTDSVFAQNNMSYAGSMTVMDFTPNVSWRLTDSWSVGAGADLYYGQVEQRTMFSGPVAMSLGLPSGTESKLTGDGEAMGWNAASTWKMTSKQRVSVTYRSPFEIDYDGDNTIGGVRASEIHAPIDYPTVAGLAYGIELADTVRAEANVEWLEFSTYQNLIIEDSAFGSTTVAQKLKNTWTAGLGAAWDFMPQWTLRSGLMYLQNPTPDKTYSPLGPDADQGVVSAGLGYATEHHVVDLGYAYGIFDGRSVRGSANSPDGQYDYNVNLLSLSYGYKF